MRKTPNKIVKKAISEYFADDSTVRDIAKKYGISEATFYNWLKRSGCRRKKRGRRKHVETTKNREEIVREYISGKGSIRDIAEKYSLEYSTLHAWIEKYRNDENKNLIVENNKPTWKDKKKRIFRTSSGVRFG